MLDWHVLTAILAVGVASYAMRTGGFLAGGLVPEQSLAARLLRLAPGNLFVAFTAAGCLEGGWPSLVGSIAALAMMALTGKEWVALAAGFGGAAAISSAHLG